MGTDTPLSFDDLEVGMAWQTPARRLEAGLIAAFAELSGDHTPIHLEPEAARQAGYPRPLAHGPLVLALAVGLLSQLGNLTASTLALRRLEWEFTRPVLADDLIRCTATVSGKRAISATAGLVDLELRVLDERDQVLQHGKLRLLLRRG